jgi:hypothetical protein
MKSRRTGMPPRHLTAVSSRNADAQALRKARVAGPPPSPDRTEPEPHVPSFLMATQPQPPVAAQSEPAPQTSREALIAEAAYLRAASRGFAPGHELEDWLAAEKMVDARLAGKAQQ